MGTIGTGIRQRQRDIPWTIRRSGIHLNRCTTQPNTALYALDTFDVTHVLDHRRRSVQRRRPHRARGRQRQTSLTATSIQPLQPDHRRHLQDHTGTDGRRLAIPRPTVRRPRLSVTPPRRSGASLHRRGVPRPRSAAEAGRHPDAEVARLRGTRKPTLDKRLGWKPRFPEEIPPTPSPFPVDTAGVRLFPERRLDAAVQGIEVESINDSAPQVQREGYALVDARFLDALQVGSNKPLSRNAGDSAGQSDSPAHPAPSHQRLALTIRSPTLSDRRGRAVCEQSILCWLRI